MSWCSSCHIIDKAILLSDKEPRQDLCSYRSSYSELLNSEYSAWCSYEKRYTEEAKLKPSEKSEENVARESSSTGTDNEGTTNKSKNSTSSTSEQDLDVFLLGDTGDSDEEPGTWLPLTNPWNNWPTVASVLHASFNVKDCLIIHKLLKSYFLKVNFVGKLQYIENNQSVCNPDGLLSAFHYNLLLWSFFYFSFLGFLWLCIRGFNPA